MVLEFAKRNVADAASSAAVQRFFIDMPVVSGKICMIRKVHWLMVEGVSRVVSNFDISFGMSLDPDGVGLNFGTLPDSSMFLVDRFVKGQITAVGFAIDFGNRVYDYDEGLPCPYSRLPFFVQHSNTGALSVTHNVKVFFTFERLTSQELAIAVARRGRGVTRRVP